MKLEPVGPDRLDEIVALVLRCDETWRPWAPRGWAPPPAERERVAWRGRLREGGHWVRGAIDDGRTLVGIASWQPASGRGRDGVAHLGMLFVDPGSWSRGIGAALLSAAEVAMREACCHTGRLNVAERNPARAFYEHHGWELAGPPALSPALDLPLVPYEKRL